LELLWILDLDVWIFSECWLLEFEYSPGVCKSNIPPPFSSEPVIGLVPGRPLGLNAAARLQIMNMKSTHNFGQGRLAHWLPLCFGLAVLNVRSEAADAPTAGMVPLDLKLPAPAFKGTPVNIQLSSYVEPLSDKPRPAMMVPAGLKNIARGKKLTSSDKNATSEMLDKITDGEKEASDQNIIFLRKGTQYVQMDLGAPQEIFAIVIWHAHNSAKVYHDVIVQASDDPEFNKEKTQTLFNNDQDNSSALGAGTDREYFETNEGRLINAKGVKARYLRFYSKGSTESALNEYTEVEVYGRPAP
jgi:hypothetical protein